MLGVRPTAGLDEVRRAHRRRIIDVHPDAGGSVAAAARVNQAYDVLRDTAAAPTQSAPAESARPPVGAEVRIAPDGGDVDRLFVLDGAPADLLARIADAGHDVGEVVYVDALSGMVEIVVGEPPGVGQLAVTVGEPTPEGTTVAFTLDALGITPAPPIRDVVDALMAALRN